MRGFWPFRPNTQKLITLPHSKPSGNRYSQMRDRFGKLGQMVSLNTRSLIEWSQYLALPFSSTWVGPGIDFPIQFNTRYSKNIQRGTWTFYHTCWSHGGFVIVIHLSTIYWSFKRYPYYKRNKKKRACLIVLKRSAVMQFSPWSLNGPLVILTVELWRVR